MILTVIYFLIGITLSILALLGGSYCRGWHYCTSHYAMGLDAIVFAPFAFLFLLLSLRRFYKKVDFTQDEELKFESFSHTSCLIRTKYSWLRFASLQNFSKLIFSPLNGRYNIRVKLMKRMFQVLFTLLFMSFGGYAHDQIPLNSKDVLLGHWILNEQETIGNFNNSEMTEAEVQEFLSILKPAEIVITEKVYSGFLQGRKPTHTPYSIISISDNGECFDLQFEDSRIPLDIQKHEICVINNRLLLSSVKGAKEVFNKKL